MSSAGRCRLYHCWIALSHTNCGLRATRGGRQVAWLHATWGHFSHGTAADEVCPISHCTVCHRKQWVVFCWILHDDVIKWKHFPRNWPFVREIHRSPVNFPHKGQWRGALMFSLIYAWINDWVNNREAGDLRRQHGHYDVIVMCNLLLTCPIWWEDITCVYWYICRKLACNLSQIASSRTFNQGGSNHFHYMECF